MENYSELERFADKKVKISIVENISTKTKNILKLYPNNAVLKIEMDWLQKLRSSNNVRVPKVIQAVDRELLLEYISGRTVLQELVDGPMFKINMVAGALARYFKAFYIESEGNVIDNINLNCYILRGGQMNGFDFVEVHGGDEGVFAVETISEILVNLKISDIRKQMFVREFLRVFGGSVLQYKDQIKTMMADKIERYGVKGYTVDELYKVVGKA